MSHLETQTDNQYVFNSLSFESYHRLPFDVIAEQPWTKQRPGWFPQSSFDQQANPDWEFTIHFPPLRSLRSVTHVSVARLWWWSSTVLVGFKNPCELRFVMSLSQQSRLTLTRLARVKPDWTGISYTANLLSFGVYYFYGCRKTRQIKFPTVGCRLSRTWCLAHFGTVQFQRDNISIQCALI